uniref:Transducin beta-like protein 2 n=1 Tax=Culex pipiens TaxID=7175 RepID=A0A8D8MR90_CULPI
MLLICASEVQKHRRISKNLATRTTTQMLVTAESTPPWTLTSGEHHLPLKHKQQPTEANQRPSRPMANSSKSTNGWSMSSVKRYAQSAPNNRQNSADPDKSEQRKVRINKSNKKKQPKLRAEMISSPRPPSSTGKLDDASNRNEKNEDRKQKHGTRTPTAGNEAAASGGAPAPAGKTGGGGRKVAVSSISTNVKKQRTADANYQHPWLYTTLKGHTGQVFDMDFSRNGKYLATCAEDSPSAQSSNGNHLINVNINANDERNTSAATTTTSSAFGDVNDVVSSSSSSSNASSGSTSSGSSTRGEDSPNAPGAGKKQRKYTKKKQQYKKIQRQQRQ